MLPTLATKKGCLVPVNICISKKEGQELKNICIDYYPQELIYTYMKKSSFLLITFGTFQLSYMHRARLI